LAVSPLAEVYRSDIVKIARIPTVSGGVGFE